MFGVSDKLFTDNFMDLCRVTCVDCVIYLYTNAIGNDEFLLKTVIAAGVPVMCVRNKCENEL